MSDQGLDLFVALNVALDERPIESAIPVEDMQETEGECRVRAGKSQVQVC